MKNLNLLIKLFLLLLVIGIFSICTLMQVSSLTKYLTLGAALFCIGLYGVLTSNSILKTLISLEILFNAANLNLIAFSRFTDLAFVRGQVFSLFVMAIASAEIAIGLALIINIYNLKKISQVSELNQLKE
jgi:NADH:ubiquinone oxidoreductase subunit K